MNDVTIIPGSALTPLFQQWSQFLINAIHGTVWRNGSGAPSNSLGLDGDYYLDTDSGNVYSRLDGVYNFTTSLKGAISSSYATSLLPAAGSAGRIALLTDGTHNLSLDTGTQWVDVGGGVFNVRNFGAKGDGVTDDSNSVQAALVACDAAGGGIVYFPSGTYILSGSRSIACADGTTTTVVGLITAHNIRIEGAQGVVWDCSASTAQYALVLGGTRLSSVSLGADVTAGTDSITVTGLTINQDDILLLSNDSYCIANDPGTFAGRVADGAWFSGERVGFYRAEMVQVYAYSSPTVTLKTRLFDNYQAAKTKVYSLQIPKISIIGIELKRNSNQGGIRITYARDIEVKNCKAYGSRERLYYLDHCFGGLVHNCYGTDFWYSGTGTSYGIAVDSCQHVTVDSCRLFGGRHAITHGGNEPFRDIHIVNCTLDNYHQSAAKCLNYHAGGEHCVTYGCAILNGIDLVAKNVEIRGNTIFGVTQSAVDINASLSSDYYHILENRIYVTGSSVYGIIVRNFEANLTFDHVVIAGNYIRNTSSFGIYVKAYLGTGTLTINHLSIRDNDVQTNSHAVILTQDTGVTTILNRVRMIGGKYSATGASASALFIGSLTTPGQITIRDCYFITGTAFLAINATSLTDASFLNCRIEGPSSSAAANVITCSGDLKLFGNTWVNWTTNAGINATAATITLEQNRYSGTSGNPSLTGSVIRHLDNPVSGTDTLETVSWSAVTQNLLTEDQASMEVTGVAWSVGGNCTVAQTSAAAWQGRFSEQLTSIASGTMSVVASTKPAVTAGVSYTLSAYTLAATTPRTTTVQIQWQDINGNLISASTTGTALLNSASSWTQVTVTGIAPANATQARLVITFNSIGGTGEVHYIDGCMFCVGSSIVWVMPGINAVTASSTGVTQSGPGGFSMGYASQNILTAQQSSFEYATSGWGSPANCTISLTTAQAYQGNQSLQMTSLASGDMDCFPLYNGSTVFFPITAGATYTFSGHIRSATVSRTAQLLIQWYDNTSTLISTSIAAPTTSTSSWVFGTITATAPSNAVTAKLPWVIKATGGAGEVHYLDQVSFNQGTSQLWYLGGNPALTYDGAKWALNEASGTSAINTDGSGHLIIPGNTPTITAGAGAGTSGSVSITGSDQGGYFIITPGSNPSSGTVATIAFGSPFASIPRGIIIAAGGANSAALFGNSAVYEDRTSRSTTGCVFKVGSTPLTSGLPYTWNYQVIG